MINYRSINRYSRRQSRVWLSVLVNLGWTILGAGIVVGCADIIFEQYSNIIGLMSTLVTTMVLIALAALVRGMRRARAMLVVEYLEQAVRLNLPLPAMLAAAERSERGWVPGRLRKLRLNVEAGAPISWAVREALPGVPDRIAGLIAAGENMAQLPRVLARAVHQPIQREHNPMRLIMFRWYPLVALIAIAMAGGVIEVFAVPKLDLIARDFHLEPPTGMRELKTALDGVVVVAAIIGVPLFLWTCGSMLAEMMAFRRDSVGPMRALVDRIAWITPIWRGVIQNRGLADVCCVMADAVGAGQPASAALANAAEVCTNRVLERRVRRWADFAGSGASLAEAAGRARMPTVMVALLATGRDSSGLQQLFDFLARYYDSRSSAAAAFIENAAVPLMTCGLAVVVAGIALQIFLPILQLLNYLSTGWRPN